MKEIKAVIQPHRLDDVLHSLHRIGSLPVVVVSDAEAIDTSPGMYDRFRMTKLELMVPDAQVAAVVDAIREAAHCGNVGDGRIFIIPIEEALVIRTGEWGEDAR